VSHDVNTSLDSPVEPSQCVTIENFLVAHYDLKPRDTRAYGVSGNVLTIHEAFTYLTIGRLGLRPLFVSHPAIFNRTSCLSHHHAAYCRVQFMSITKRCTNASPSPNTHGFGSLHRDEIPQDLALFSRCRTYVCCWVRVLRLPVTYHRNDQALYPSWRAFE
jgi:hypothetical protein